jgi:hypothetical protein
MVLKNTYIVCRRSVFTINVEELTEKSRLQQVDPKQIKAYYQARKKGNTNWFEKFLGVPSKN